MAAHLDPEIGAAAMRTLLVSDDPIVVFDAFVVLNTDPSLHAHFADNDTNDAERVRAAIRRAIAPTTLSGGARYPRDSGGTAR
ncbi:hypothetical protein [Mycolicibacter heraklionensis]|uniref:hypothetical protein n=1 Tax=Mycolicibacter heraklionensis TaxID=512402 RepID=UPI0006998B80|nr:hypothetical protein [Mycolicibacter heraklionensis]